MAIRIFFRAFAFFMSGLITASAFSMDKINHDFSPIQKIVYEIGSEDFSLKHKEEIDKNNLIIVEEVAIKTIEKKKGEDNSELTDEEKIFFSGYDDNDQAKIDEVKRKNKDKYDSELADEEILFFSGDNDRDQKVIDKVRRERIKQNELSYVGYLMKWFGFKK